MKPTVDIVEELLQDFTPKSKILTSVDNAGIITITVCNRLNIREGSLFTIDGEEYKALTVNGNTITYEGLIPIDKYIYPNKPFYFHGTPIATGGELNTIDNSINKLPMVYLYEVIRDNIVTDKLSALERESTIRLFFLDEANFSMWDTDKHYSNAILPQANYAYAFLDYLKNSPTIGVIESAELTYHAKFGISINQNGHIKNLFADELSGVELTLTLPIKKSFFCANC